MAGAAGADGAGLLPSPPPAICRHFNAPTGCRRPNCGALHVCFYFVTGRCRFGARCRLPHSLETEHTVALLRQLGCSPSRRQLTQLLTELQRKYSSGGGSSSGGGGGPAGGGPAGDGPRVCVHYNGSGCLATDCASLHLCYLLVTGRCPGRQCCRRPMPRSHSLTSAHNSRVLRLCGLRDTAIPELLRRLRLEADERPLRPSICRRYNCKDGCPSGDCLQLHCCFYFACGDCVYGERCRLDHLLSSAHNYGVLRFYGLDAPGALLAIRQDLRAGGTAPAGSSPGASSVADAEVSRTELAQLRQQRDAETAGLLDEQDKLERTLWTVAELNSEAERELASSRQASRALQVEAEHASLVAQERERQLAERQGSLLTERHSLELSLLATAESSEQLESVVSGLNAKLSVLEVDYQRSRQEQQRLADALEQERRLQREQEERREQDLERTLVCSVCLEMFVAATTLGCSHTFCRACVASVQQRLGGGALCPMCRAPIRSQTPSITLNQMVERAVQTMSQEKRTSRRAVLRERGLPETAG